MKLCAGFLAGTGLGLLAGAMASAAMPTRSRSMKRRLGRSVRKMGNAVDRAMDNLISELS